jgi:hypothetical protein
VEPTDGAVLDNNEVDEIGGVEDDEDDDDYDDDDDDDDEDMLSEEDLERYIRAAAAWTVAVEALQDEPRFGPCSFGLIALGEILGIVKKAKQLSDLY